jgi:hypothetical protein
MFAHCPRIMTPWSAADHLVVEGERVLRSGRPSVTITATTEGYSTWVWPSIHERTASLYLDGLLDTDEHQGPETDRARAEQARREVQVAAPDRAAAGGTIE